MRARGFAGALFLILAAFVLTASAEKLPPLPEGAFTYAVIPDTQGYDGEGRTTKRGRAPGVGPTRNAQLDKIVVWFATNAAKERILFVTHTGDITDMNNDFQWALASNAMSRLDGVVPYAVVPGNHDMKPSGDTTFFRKYFPASRFSSNAWYAGTFEGFDAAEGFRSSGDNANSVCLFESGTEKFVVLHLECNAPDPVLAWGNAQLEKYADRHAIVATHQDLGAIESKNARKIMNDMNALKAEGKNPKRYEPDLSTLGRMEWFKCHRKNKGNSGRQIWEKLSSRHANVFLVVSGDQGMVNVTRVDEKGTNGNLVVSLMQDTGRGYVRLFRFVPAEKCIRCYTIDPAKDGELVHQHGCWRDDKWFNFEIPYPGAAGTPATPPAVSASKSDTSDPIAARQCAWKGVPNVRDLGGLPTRDGRKVRTGRIYRSAGLNENAHYRDKAKKTLPREEWKGPGRTRLDEATRTYLTDTLGLRTDLDLRNEGETFGMTGSPLGEKVRWVHIESTEYAGIGKESGRKAFAACFRVFLDEKNYPIVFHCIAGADRTGSLACVLNGLLGVDEQLLHRDWTYTWTRNGRTPEEKRWMRLMSVFAKYEGATLSERIEAYVLSNGFTKEEIAKFRSLMLD